MIIKPGGYAFVEGTPFVLVVHGSERNTLSCVGGWVHSKWRQAHVKWSEFSETRPNPLSGQAKDPKGGWKKIE